ncbi:decorin-binding protein DbpA [Borreliella bavariensis]|uniref:decorin-binding protein DbpA n=1 Tax=Borreliella bavariensis TaxID=664662 RepID=UPI001C013587|nr:decorin-binding protein DbpA [Borreliella bavariensis]
MTKYIKNLLKLTLIVGLFTACGLTGETKIRLESSAKEVKDEINKIREEAVTEGVNFAAFTDKQTGSKVAENPFIIKAKIRATNVALKFVQAIKEEAEKLKESGGSSQFSAMYALMFDISEPIEKIGVKDMTKTVELAAKKNPSTTVEGILEIAKKMEEKLQNVNRKNTTALKNLEEKSATAATTK